MKNSKSKQTIIKKFKSEQEKLLNLTKDVSEKSLIKPSFAKGWSVKDVFSHLCYWDWWTISAIEQILAGILPPYFDKETDDKVNEREVEMRQKRSWNEVLEEFRRASEAVILKLENTPGNLFFKDTGVCWKNRKVTINWVLSYDHYKEHINQLKQWKENF